MHQNANPSTLIIAGAGYTGGRLARAMRDRRPLALVRTQASAAGLRDAGVDAQQLDFDKTAAMPHSIDPAATCLYLAPPPGVGDDDTRLARFLRLLPGAGRFVYVSTTGVYGDCGGALVDEDRPPAPATARARRRLAAEIRVRGWCEQNDTTWVILRVPGIYGPGRLQRERLRGEKPVVVPTEAPPGNRIHVDDLVGALVAATGVTVANQVFNISDGDHADQYRFLETLARLTGGQPPPTVSMATARATFSPVSLSFLNESRRIDNRRMIETLGVSLRYPDHISGIRASLAEEAS